MNEQSYLANKNSIAVDLHSSMHITHSSVMHSTLLVCATHYIARLSETKRIVEYFGFAQAFLIHVIHQNFV